MPQKIEPMSRLSTAKCEPHSHMQMMPHFTLSDDAEPIFHIGSDFRNVVIATPVKRLSACTYSIYRSVWCVSFTTPQADYAPRLHECVVCILGMCICTVCWISYYNPPEVSYTPFYLHAVTVPT